MMRYFLGSTCRVAATSVAFAGALVVARLGVWAAGGRAWATLPVAGGIILAVYAAKALARASRDGREAYRLARARAAPTDPGLESRIRLTWRAGMRAARAGGGFFFPPGPPRPIYICMGADDARRRRLIALAAPPGGKEVAGEFTWRIGPRAVWLDLDFAWDDDPAGRWPLFLSHLRRDAAGMLAGVAATLDAAFLLTAGEEALRTAAGTLGRRLADIQENCSVVPPVYLLVNRVDCLYGMRSAAGALGTKRLAKPLGDFRLTPRETPAGFVRRVIGQAADALSVRDIQSSTAAAGAAVCQAPAELARLVEPLTFFCAEALGQGAGASAAVGGGSGTPNLAGLFFGSTGQDAPTLPPLLPAAAGIVPVVEAAEPRVWFWTELLREILPRAARPVPSVPRGRMAGGLCSRAGLTGLLCGTLALCWMMTGSFVESRSMLTAASGRIAPPSDPARLEPLFEIAAFTRERNDDWWLPRFGMREAEELEEEVTARFVDSYFDLKTIPHIERVQDLAQSAAGSQDPARVGGVLLQLILARGGIARCLEPAGVNQENAAYLESLAERQGLVSAGELRLRDKFYAWSGPRDWMPATQDALTRFERYLIDKTSGGSLVWLAGWAESLPGVQAIDTGSVWAPQPPAGLDPQKCTVAPAWTAEAYHAVRRLLDAIVYDAGAGADWAARRDAFLAEYRREAREQWKAAADELWNHFRETVSDRHLRALTRQATRGDDPAARFAALLRRHLVPMFDGAPPDPDIAWLLELDRLFVPPEREAKSPAGQEQPTPLSRFVTQVVTTARGLASDDGLAEWSRQYLEPEGRSASGFATAASERFVVAIRRIGVLAESAESNLTAVRNQYRNWAAGARVLSIAEHEPFLDAAAAAEELHRHLVESTGGNAWNSLSPLTRYNYVRYLASRQAALALDAVWRETVYNPHHISPGGFTAGGADAGNGLAERIDKFLNGPARGFWTLEDGRLAVAAWDRIKFMLSPDFLAFCGETLAAGRHPGAASLTLPFHVESVTVDVAATTRPLYAEFTVAGGGEPEKVTYRNFATDGAFTWRRGAAAEVTAEIVFPSFRLTRRITGAAAVAEFVRAFDGGVWTLSADSFPERAAELAGLGISRVAVRGAFPNRDEFLRQFLTEVPSPPESILSAASARDDETILTPGVFAQAVWER